MTSFATDADLLEYVPDIKKYGIQEFTAEHTKTYDDIIRLLNIRWWPTAEYGRYDLLTVKGATKLTASKLDATQFKRAAVYHVLGYHIFPKLTTWDPDRDAFREQMDFYKARFEEEFQLIISVGVSYDADASGTYEDGEKQSFYSGRLIR
tara:strand:+ start:747 stop:1196 length:450 start_codon:yes stop_codon:yes gene_type:complete